MNSASSDIREMTHEEISDVNGGEAVTCALVFAGIALFAAGVKLGYDAGRDIANWRDERDKEKRAADPKK